jgi:hypothetical protein
MGVAEIDAKSGVHNYTLITLIAVYIHVVFKPDDKYAVEIHNRLCLVVRLDLFNRLDGNMLV